MQQSLCDGSIIWVPLSQKLLSCTRKSIALTENVKQSFLPWTTHVLQLEPVAALVSVRSLRRVLCVVNKPTIKLITFLTRPSNRLLCPEFGPSIKSSDCLIPSPSSLHGMLFGMCFLIVSTLISELRSRPLSGRVCGDSVLSGFLLDFGSRRVNAACMLSN